MALLRAAADSQSEDPRLEALVAEGSRDTHHAPRGPLLLTSGSDDHTVPTSVTLEVLAMYGENPGSVTDYLEFDARGHSLTIHSSWRVVADATLAWLYEQHLDAARPASTTAA